MTLEQAFEICKAFWLLLGVIGCPLAMSAGFRTKTRTVRPGVSRTKRVMSASVSKKKKKAKRTKQRPQPMSEWDQRTLTDYFIRRDFVGVKN